MQDERLIRLPGVLERIGVKKSTLWNWVKAGKFPQPIKLSERVTVWRSSDVQKWIDEMAAGAAT
jgi:prophage regulatory protein